MEGIRSSRASIGALITIIMTLAFAASITPPTVAIAAPCRITANAAAVKYGTQGANMWGSVAGCGAGTIVAQANVGGSWRDVGRVHSNGDGGYVLALGGDTQRPGTHQIRARLGDSTSPTITMRRIGAPTASSAGSKPVGQATNVWGAVPGGAHVRVWTEARKSSGWSQSQVGTTKADGGYVLPLTYGINTPGTYTYRVGARHADGTVVYSPEFTLRRTGTKPPPTPGPKPSPGGPDCRKTACVAITFDDGPGPYTARLLDILRQHDAKATFMVLGPKVEQRPSVMRRMVAEGHQVGNHSWNHPNLAKQSSSTVRTELTSTSNAIKRVTGKAPTVMRPPYGAHSRMVRDVVRSTGSGPVILWDVDTLDWKTRSASATIRSVRNDARRGSIILMHDIHSSTVDAVPGVIKELKAKGYTLVTVDQLLASEATPSGSVHTHGPRG